MTVPCFQTASEPMTLPLYSGLKTFRYEPFEMTVPACVSSIPLGPRVALQSPRVTVTGFPAA
jgi:hypothetical protein